MQTNPNLPERFWSKVDKSGPCWRWTGGHRNGYGIYFHNGKQRPVSRVICVGLPPDKNVRRTCREPWCINPDHLYCDTSFEPVWGDKLTIDEVVTIAGGGECKNPNIPPRVVQMIKLFVDPSKS